MITEVCYASRDDVKNAPDFKNTAANNQQVDRAILAATKDIDKHLHRKFYPEDTTKYFDWPPQSGQGGGQITYPWKVYFDQHNLISLTSIQSPPGTSLNTAYINLEPANDGPPYTYMELQRDKNISFSGGNTPQRSIAVTGTWGYKLDTDQVATLSAAISSSSATTITISNGANVGPGDLIIVDSERLLVQEKTSLTTGQTQQGSGVSTSLDNDNVLAVTDGTQFSLNEVLLLDAEKMFVTDITGNNLTVIRGWDGTVLATHSGSTVYAYRTLTVARGQLGTSAATHSNSAPVNKLRVPNKIRNLCVAEAVNTVLQETSGYSRTVGSPEMMMTAPGAGLADMWDEAYTDYGRKNRFRGI